MKGKLRVLIAVTAALLLIAALTPAVLADNEPHDSTMLTEADGCAACHRAHTAQAAKLLKETSTQDAFCFTCHDGSAAETNVVDGVLAGTSYGSNGGPLRGGGFTNALMDTDHDGSAVSAAVTSTHTADGVTSGIIWGSGPINTSTDYGTSVTLACGDCHNPHGNGNYRILRGNPDGMENEGSAAAVDVTDEVTIVYEITYTANDYRDMSDYAVGTPNLIGEWCSQCHTRYWAGANAGETDSTDDVFAYRHMTNGLTGSCLACHVAHGTSATMATNSNAVTYPNGTTQGGNESRLLSGDNRSVCTDPDSCHGNGGWGLTED